MESVKNFVGRVESRTGLNISRIPDAPEDVMLGGAIIASSPHGTLVYTDWSHQDDDGVDIYSKAVLVNRSARLPAADQDADGILPTE